MAKYKKTEQKAGNAMDTIKKEVLHFSKRLTHTKQAIATGLSDIQERNIKMKKISFKTRVVVTHHNPSWDTYSFF